MFCAKIFVFALFVLYGAWLIAYVLFYSEVFFISAKDFAINEDIRAKEVRVIDDEGNQLGILQIAAAKKAAYDKGLDLVEVAPQATPPTCRIMDYGKFRFENEKKEKESRKKQQVVEIKEIQLSCRIDTHDYETKLKHARRFLSEGNKVKVAIKFKGREMAHTQIGFELITKFGADCSEMGNIEKAPALDGRQLLMFLAPKVDKQTLKKQKAVEKQAEKAVKE